MKDQDEYYVLLDYVMKNIVIPLNLTYQGLSDHEKDAVDKLMKSESVFSKIKKLVKK